MAVSRWDPLREMVALQQRMNQLFNSTLSRTHEEDQLDLASGSWTPPVDIHESGERIVLRADLPGISQQEIDIRVENNTLTVRGERRMDPEVRREEFLRVERPYGAFSRVFSLPATVDLGSIQASYRDGVLEIALSKKPEMKAQSVRIDVK